MFLACVQHVSMHIITPWILNTYTGLCMHTIPNNLRYCTLQFILTIIIFLLTFVWVFAIHIILWECIMSDHLITGAPHCKNYSLLSRKSQQLGCLFNDINSHNLYYSIQWIFKIKQGGMLREAQYVMSNIDPRLDATVLILYLSLICGPMTSSHHWLTLWSSHTPSGSWQFAYENFSC